MRAHVAIMLVENYNNVVKSPRRSLAGYWRQNSLPHALAVRKLGSLIVTWKRARFLDSFRCRGSGVIAVPGKLTWMFDDLTNRQQNELY